MITILFACIYAFLGSLAGITAGLLGVGGGVVTVPCLFFLLHQTGMGKEEAIRSAVATSLLCTTVNSAAAAYFHYRNKQIERKILRYMLPGILPGAAVGSLLITKISGSLLTEIFGIFSLGVALRFLFPAGDGSTRFRKIPGTWSLCFLGTLISSGANLLGVGGGVFTVPLLGFFGCDLKKTTATSSCLSFFISGAGSAFLLYETFVMDGNGPDYIRLFPFSMIAIFGVLFSHYGVRLSHKLPESITRKIFSLAMFLVAGFMLFR